MLNLGITYLIVPDINNIIYRLSLFFLKPKTKIELRNHYLILFFSIDIFNLVFSIQNKNNMNRMSDSLQFL